MEKEVKIVHQNQKFSLKISEKLERKIRVLCNKFPTTEWSGQLFYTYTGSFEKGDIEFIAEDLLFMDTGCGVTTEFYLDEGNTIGYMCDHDLLNCQVGLIHSHHNMGAFFSGQDDAMLLQEGLSRNHFVSLVVDNRGTYVARVTAKEVYEHHIQTVKKFRTFNDVAVETPEGEQVQTSTVVSTYDLAITNEFFYSCDDYEELMETIKQCDEIKKQRLERERKEEKKKEKKGKKNKPFYQKPPKQGKAVQKEISFPYQPDADSQTFNSSRHHWEDEVPNFEEVDPFSGEPLPNEIPDKVLTDERVAYYASQIVSLGFLHTNVNGVEKFLENMGKFIQDRFKDVNNYKNAVTWMCDYLLDTELLDEIDQIYPPHVSDEAFTQAKLQLAEYFLDLIKSHPQIHYLQIIYDYINS